MVVSVKGAEGLVEVQYKVGKGRKVWLPLAALVHVGHLQAGVVVLRQRASAVEFGLMSTGEKTLVINSPRLSSCFHCRSVQ